MNQALRDLILANPGKTDAEVAALYPAYARAPRTDRVTYTTFGAMWGVARAAEIRGTLKAIATSDNPLAGLADYVHGLLSGPGFDPQHPEAAEYVGEFVSGNVITADEGTDALWVVPAAPAEADVAAERRGIAVGELNLLRVAQDNGRIAKLAYLAANPSADLPADLAGLDAFAIPADGGQ